MKGWIRCLAFLAGFTLQVAALAQSTNFVPMASVRLLDTRAGGTTFDGQFIGGGPLVNQSLDLLVAGRGNVPGTGISAVVLTVTVTAPTAAGYVTVWPTGVARPTTSNLNFVSGRTISNQVIAKVGANGRVSVYAYTSGATAQIIVDVAGYFPAASDLNPLTPARLLDTRPGNPTTDGQYSGGGAVSAGGTLDLLVAGRGGVPSSGVGAVVVNVTATQPTAAGYITVWPTGSAQPLASNLNLVPGQTVPNLVMVAPGAGGKISFYNAFGNTQLIVDVIGYFSTATATFTPLVPARLMDTRAGAPTIDGQFSGQGAFTPGLTFNLRVWGRGGVPSTGVGAVALNLTAVAPSATGYLVAWGKNTTSGNAPPQANSLNFWSGSVIPDLVIAQVGADGDVSIYNNTGNTHVIADVVGWFPGADYGAPKPPTSVTVAATSTSNTVTASWTLDSSGPPATYLKIQRGLNSAGPSWTMVNNNYTPATSGQMSELVSATGTYFYEVAACNVAGCSAYKPSTAGATVSVIPGTPTSDAPVATATPATDSISDAIGATAAQFRVDEGGNATYSIPIQVPPGTAGVAPKLALSYNGRLPYGVMGPGWTIEGSSQISRCRQTRESGDFGQADGNPSPVNFTASDRFCLDGVRLLLLGGNSANSGKSYGDNGTVYSPETDPTTRVTASVTGTYVGPDSFKVQRKDGTTSTYGYMASSPNALATASLTSQTVAVNWSLARVQDSKGNYIDYLYNSRPGSSTLPFAAAAVETTLAQVNYTGHATSPVSSPYASISFTYAALPTNLVRIGYQSGVMFAQTQELSCVTVTSGTTAPTSCTDSVVTSSTLRYYTLTYGTSLSGSQFRQVQQIRECRDSTKVVCFPPTTFNWSGATNTFVAPSPQYQTPGGPNFTSLAGYKIADVDGDGRQDFVWAVNEGSGGPCGNGKSSIYVGFLDRTSAGQMTITTTGQAATCAAIDLTNSDQAWALLDYDGDGRADLLLGGAASSTWKVLQGKGRPTTTGTTIFGSDLLAAQGIVITASPCFVSAFTNATVCDNATGILADINGDGLPDFIVAESSNYGWDVRLLQRQSDGSLKFSSPYTVLYTVNDATFQSFDHNRSPFAEITALNSNTSNHRSAIAADVNGDGRTDLTALVDIHQDPPCAPANCVVTTPSRFRYWAQFTVASITPPNGSTPGKVQLNETWFDSNLVVPVDSSVVYVADLNGDGLADILYQDATTATTYWALINNGNTSTQTSMYNAAISVTGISNGKFLQLVDINGDGKVDLVYPVTSSTDSTAFSSFNYVSVAANSSGWYFTAAVQVPGSPIGHNDWIHLFGDFDGDGAPDYFGLSTTATSNNLYASRAANGSRYQPHDVITDFTNGLGATTHVAYQPLTNIGVYQRRSDTYPILRNGTDFGWGSPVFDVLAPMYVVSQASSSAPTQADAAAKSTVYYRYSGAVMQAGGRGFLGFYETWSFDGNDIADAGNQYVGTLNRYAQHYPFIGMPIATLKEVYSGAAITRGNNVLDTCAAAPETLGYNCFSGITGTSTAPTFQTPWPDIISTSSSLSGIRISLGGQQPACAGEGCTTYTANQCMLGGGSAQASLVKGLDSDLFTPPANAGPLFSFAAHTTDTQYDLGSGTASNPVAVATINNYFCYDEGTYTAPSRGNLQSSRTANFTADALGSNKTAVAEKVTTNLYDADDASNWYFGRLTSSQVQFARPGQTTRTRTTTFTYDSTSGLLLSEEIQKGTSTVVDQDLRTFYDLDAFGNRTAAYQCSNNLTETQCRAGASNNAGIAQRQTGTTVLRYAKTTYDSRGRYVTGSRLPFATASGGWNEQVATAITSRDEFGNATQQSSINGTTQTAQFGVLGRPYFTNDNIGHASTTTFRLCGAGTNKASCGSNSDGRLVFRSQTVTAGGASNWTYFDVLGRPVMKVAQAFDNNPAAQRFTASCAFTDGHNRATYQSEPFFLNATEAANGSPTISGTACSSASYATTTAYDVLGRAVTITTPDGATTQQYVGLSTFVTNARGFTWETLTNEMGEAVQTLDPGTVNNDAPTALTVTQTYDAMGDVLTITRNAGSGTVTSSFTYDALGRKLTQSDADSGQTTFTYNAAGDVLTQTDAKGQTITQSYDALGRKWQRVASSTSGTWIGTITDAWNYDTASNGFGQLASETHVGTGDTNLTRTLTYDGYGRLYQRQHQLGTYAYTETMTVDGYSRAKQQQDATGQITTTHYTTKGFVDKQNDSRLATSAQSGTIDSGVGGRLYELLQTNERGQPVSEKRGGSTSLATTLSYYANDGRLKGVCTNGTGTCALQDDQYAYDAVGNVTARLKNASSGKSPVEQLSYDGLNRLTQSQLGAWSGTINNGVLINVIGTQAMTYDALGNLCTQAMTGTQVTNTTQTYTYAGPAGCANHGATGSSARVTAISGTVNQTYQYDANGNQTIRGDGRTLTYNALNQAVRAQLGGDTTTFQYGPNGERYLRNDNGLLTLYIGKVEITISGGTTSEQKRYLGVAIDLVMANDTRYVLTDHLGSTNVIARVDGTKVESEAFDAWGNRRDPGTWTQTGITYPIQTTTHGFTGQEGVEAMGIIHFNGRIYDPSLGRMLQADPVRSPGSQGLNRYAYVANNPLTLTDPTGFSWLSGLLHFSDNMTGFLLLGPGLYDQFHNQWNSFISNPYVRMAGAIVAAAFTGWATYGAFSAEFVAGTGGAITAGAVSGAGAGFVAGAITSRSFQAAWQGAIAGAITGGVLKGFGGSNWFVRATANGIAGGLSANILGGKFSTGFEFAFFGSLIKSGLDAYDSYRLRQDYSSSLDTGTEDAVYKPTAEMQRIAAGTDDAAADMRARFVAAGCDPLGDVCGVTREGLNKSLGR